MRQTLACLAMRYSAELYHRKNQRTYGLGAMLPMQGLNSFPYVIYNDYYNHEDFGHSTYQHGYAGVLWTPEAKSFHNSGRVDKTFPDRYFFAHGNDHAWSSGPNLVLS